MSEGHDLIQSALKHISGVPVTAYLDDGNIDKTKTKAVVAKMALAGIRNILSAGNTGEFFALSLDEITDLHAATIAAVDGKAIVTAGVGRSLRDARLLATRAITEGANAIMGHHPMDPFAAPSGQAEYFLRLADACSVPFIAYVRSDAMAVGHFKRLAEHGNILGVKFASPNVMLLAEVIRATRHCPTIWVCGLAEGWAPAFYAMGAKGFTSGLANIFPEISLAVHAALEAGDYQSARNQIDRIAALEAMRTKYSNGANVTVIKEALEWVSGAVGPVRIPGLEYLNEREREELKTILGALSNPKAGSEASHFCGAVT